ncbi:hypothetical protein HETIRDRAFT_103912 [Heterobasidion irregulare TC 32-1]|uniref:Uncharacterized protein n=1 Tax=Heterobasidion irregulare (strain TC 32-1) TaxID=747525 RepID=W4JY40_HETIT|nr:uncharacterized protein HETIRDRAFT_103912 [Heterobasidion irregulare TC 32-1]ETW78497.1 hypothetical protein HETIRDRAFT_103912 [Heterobasidion irregulare TC 32-1]
MSVTGEGTCMSLKGQSIEGVHDVEGGGVNGRQGDGTQAEGGAGGKDENKTRTRGRTGTRDNVPASIVDVLIVYAHSPPLPLLVLVLILCRQLDLVVLVDV